MAYKLPHVNPCPSCGANLDGATELEEEASQPEPGDCSVCAHCHVMLRFDENMKSQLLSVDEYIDLPVEMRSQLDRAVRVLKEHQFL